MENQQTEKAPIPMLSFENHRDWFQDMYFLLERKQVEDAIEKPQISTPQSESTNIRRQKLRVEVFVFRRELTLRVRRSEWKCLYCLSGSVCLGAAQKCLDFDN